MPKTTIDVFDVPNNPDAETIIDLAQQLQDVCSKYGINAFQPGAMKELKTAKILNHCWVINKKEADACNDLSKTEMYEYLSGTENGAGQIDRVFKDDPSDPIQHEKHLQSMERITRNKWFYLGYTNQDTSRPLDILRIYQVSPDDILEETKRQLDNSINKISHVSFNENFARDHGKLIYQKK